MRRLLVLTIILFVAGACERPSPPGRERPAPVVRPSAAPTPSPVPASPARRQLDEAGQLREAADRLYGFPLPVGAYPIRESPYGSTLGLETPTTRLVRFYASRGFAVTRGRGGLLVEHTARSAEGVGSLETLRRVRLHLHEGERGMRELRFLLSAP